MRRVYLAGPMRGLPNFNFPTFYRAAAVLRDEFGYEVFNPAEADDAAGLVFSQAELVSGRVDPTRENKVARECFLRDTDWICREADAIALLPGWERSKGALAEKALGEALGLDIYYLDEDGVIEKAETIAVLGVSA